MYRRAGAVMTRNYWKSKRFFLIRSEIERCFFFFSIRVIIDGHQTNRRQSTSVGDTITSLRIDNFKRVSVFYYVPHKMCKINY